MFSLYERYEEAEIFLKSLIFHLREDRRVVVHLLVDKGGYVFFMQIFDRYDFSKRFPNIAFVTHDYDSVCDRGTNEFLSKFSAPQSPHHSGKAGYCRLFIPRYFSQLGLQLQDNARAYEKIIIPKKLVVMETDQLLLVDIAELWAQ